MIAALILTELLMIPILGLILMSMIRERKRNKRLLFQIWVLRSRKRRR